MKHIKTNLWTAILDIINAVLFLISWPIIFSTAFSDATSNGNSTAAMGMFFYFMAALGTGFSVASLIESKNRGVSIVGPILSILGNLLFFFTAAMALPATVILIIAIVLLFMHRQSKTTSTGKPFYKVWWFWIIAVVLAIILFAAHSGSTTNKNSNSSSSTSGETKVEKSKTDPNKETNSDYSFKNGVFKGPKFTIKISQTKLGVDKSENSRGIIAYFEITNDSKKSFKPSEALYYLKFKQSNGKSNYDLDDTFDSSEALFPTHNDDKSVLDDTDAYEANSDKQDEFKKTYEDPLSADLLPGKSVTVAQGYKLKDQNHPVYVHGYANLYDGKSIGSPYKIDLN